MNITKETIWLMMVCAISVFIGVNVNAFASDRTQKAAEGSTVTAESTITHEKVKDDSRDKKKEKDIGYLGSSGEGYLVDSPQRISSLFVFGNDDNAAAAAIDIDIHESQNQAIPDADAGNACSAPEQDDSNDNPSSNGGGGGGGGGLEINGGDGDQGGGGDPSGLSNGLDNNEKGGGQQISPGR